MSENDAHNSELAKRSTNALSKRSNSLIKRGLTDLEQFDNPSSKPETELASIQLPKTLKLDLGNKVALDLILVPRGTCMVGSPENDTYRWHDEDESLPVETLHEVTISNDYYMGKFAVTQEQYQAVIGENPSKFKGKDNPVEQVSWYDAQAFCQKLSDQTKQTVCLPTEAEWEYACRAGTTTAFYSGDSEADLARVAWYGYDGNNKRTSHPVGQKEANTFGLYDMHGNVCEWCADWYGAYPAGAVKDPTGANSGSYRVLRGGSWYNNLMFCRSARRFYGAPVIRDCTYGFRVVQRVTSRTH